MNITGYPQVPHILKWADPYLYLLHLLTLSHLKIKSGRSLKWSCRLQWWMHAWHKMAWAYRKRGGVFGQVHNIRLFFKHAVLNHVPRQVGPLSYTTEEEKSDHWFKKSGNERVERVRTVAYINTHTDLHSVLTYFMCFCVFWSSKEGWWRIAIFQHKGLLLSLDGQATWSLVQQSTDWVSSVSC